MVGFEKDNDKPDMSCPSFLFLYFSSTQTYLTQIKHTIFRETYPIMMMMMMMVQINRII